jgi:hypothetical protein
LPKADLATSGDIDWSLCDPTLKAEFDAIVANTLIITDKDKNGLSLAGWTADQRSNQFLYSALGDKDRFFHRPVHRRLQVSSVVTCKRLILKPFSRDTPSST